MRQNLLFIMSMAGSMIFILYILIYSLTEKYLSLKWQYGILKIAICFYLIPIPSAKYLIMSIIYRFFPQIQEKINTFLDGMDIQYTIIVSRGLTKLSPKVRYILVLICIILTFSIVVIWKQWLQYRKWEKICLIGAEKPTGFEQEIFTKVKKEMCIEKYVRLICSEYCTSPIVSGILFPILIFPKYRNEINTDEYKYMLQHELAHIKHHDLLIRYMGLLVIAVHWYNPFAYIMFFELSIISEMYCDSVVISGKGEGERRKYGELILRLAVQNKSKGNVKNRFVMGIANHRNKRTYKRRILEMKKERKYKTVLSAVITAFICLSGGMTVFAYDPPKIILDAEGELDAESDFTIRTSEDNMSLPSDYFFTDDNGNVYDISYTRKSERRICFHDFSIHGTLNEHKKDGSGGCVVKVYDALICSKCSSVKKGELKNTITYNPCPH